MIGKRRIYLIDRRQIKSSKYIFYEEKCFRNSILKMKEILLLCSKPYPRPVLRQRILLSYVPLHRGYERKRLTE